MKTRYVLHVAALLGLITLPVAAASITTTFSQNDGASGAMFDLTTNGSAITLTGLSLLDNSTAALTLDVYIKSGSYVGFDTTPGAWTLVSTSAVATGKGNSTPTPVSLTPFTLAANKTYGIYVTFTTTSNPPNMLYTRGSNSYSNSDLSLSLGEGLNGLFGATSVFPGRTWDGTLDYALGSAAPEPSSLALLALAVAPGLLLLQRRRSR